jgi:hypothetical protein
MTTPRRIYTVEQYRADCAALDLKRNDAPTLRRMLDELVTADVELVAVGAPPPESGVRVRRDTIPGGFVSPIDAATALPPVTPAVLRAAGLTPRPSARGGAR